MVPHVSLQKSLKDKRHIIHCSYKNGEKFMFAISCSIVQTYDSLNVFDMLLPNVADAMQNERILSPVSRPSLQNAQNIVHTTTM